MKPKWVVKRKQVSTDNRLIDTQLLVHIDVAGVPNWISEKNTIMQPIRFQNEEWAIVNLEQCMRYLTRHQEGAKFEVELEQIPMGEPTKQPVERGRS